MKTYILVGEVAIKHFENEDYNELEDSIINNFNGDLVAWNKETDSVSTLLDMLSGWTYFVELTEEDLKSIEANTRIEVNYED